MTGALFDRFVFASQRNWFSPFVVSAKLASLVFFLLLLFTNLAVEGAATRLALGR